MRLSVPAVWPIDPAVIICDDIAKLDVDLPLDVTVRLTRIGTWSYCYDFADKIGQLI
jgi:hypothetical protein